MSGARLDVCALEPGGGGGVALSRCRCVCQTGSANKHATGDGNNGEEASSCSLVLLSGLFQPAVVASVTNSNSCSCCLSGCINVLIVWPFKPWQKPVSDRHQAGPTEGEGGVQRGSCESLRCIVPLSDAHRPGPSHLICLFQPPSSSPMRR